MEQVARWREIWKNDNAAFAALILIHRLGS